MTLVDPQESQDPTDPYDGQRPRAFAIAYDMLGSVSEAEDVVQEAFLRVHQAQQRGEQIESPPAYLATVVTRLSIDHLRSARVRREEYVGEWLPEPLAADATPDEQAEVADSLSLAFLVVLERLTPHQRAAFLLREVFQYPYPEVADIVGTDVDGARHLVARARTHVREHRPRSFVSERQQEELAARFFAAAEHGDVAGLEQLLADDGVLRAVGGGQAQAAAKPIDGRVRVARVVARGMGEALRAGMRLEPLAINGQPGALALDDAGRLVGVLGLDVAEGQVRAIHAIVNPDKLRHLAHHVPPPA